MKNENPERSALAALVAAGWAIAKPQNNPAACRARRVPGADYAIRIAR